MLGVIDHQLAAELERILADRVRQLVHEAFDVDGVVIDVHAAPEAGRDRRVAHRVVDQQVRDRVAERGLGAARVETRKRCRVLPVLQPPGRDRRQDRLAGNAHVQPGQIVVGIERGSHPALRDRMIPAVRHVLLAGPQQLHRRAWHLLGNEDRLARVVL